MAGFRLGAYSLSFNARRRVLNCQQITHCRRRSVHDSVPPFPRSVLDSFEQAVIETSTTVVDVDVFTFGRLPSGSGRVAIANFNGRYCAMNDFITMCQSHFKEDRN